MTEDSTHLSAETADDTRTAPDAGAAPAATDGWQTLRAEPDPLQPALPGMPVTAADPDQPELPLGVVPPEASESAEPPVPTPDQGEAAAATLSIPSPPPAPDIPQPTPWPAPAPEPVPVPTPGPMPEPVPVPAPGPAEPPLPTPEPVEPAPAPEPAAPEPGPEPEPEPESAPEPAEPEPAPAAELSAPPAAEPAADAEGAATPAAEPAADAEGAATPAAEPAAPPAAEPAADAEGAATPAAEPAAGQAPNPRPTPAPRPTPPGRRHRPGAPGGRPAQHAPAHSPAVATPVEPVDPHLWGRIDQDGVVYVRTAAGERVIGNWQAGDAEAGLAHFGHRFDDLTTEIVLLESRLATGSGDPKATKHQAEALRDSLDTVPAIGDLDSAAARLEDVIAASDRAISGASQARAAARARAVAAKEALCTEAEELAESTQWKAAGDRLRAIVEEWRTIHGIDRKTDDGLWKRFAKARDTFTRRRGSHFADLDKQRSVAREAKEELITRAEALADSSDWGETSAAFRTLMTEWKAAGRAPRDVEDALWQRFRAAQETFFARRNKTFSERDATYDANAAAKEKLLAEAAAIDPAADLDEAKRVLRSVQERWEAAGRVPRERVRELDGRLRAVEDKVRAAEQAHWRRTDPETAARVAQFRSRVESYRAQADKARAAGDERKAAEAEANAAQWQEYLAAAEGAVDG